MNASLIINARDRLAWHRRLFSDASTVFMWGAWLKLLYPLVQAAAWVVKVSVLSHVAMLKVVPSGTIAGAPRYAVALVGASGTLLVWSRLPAFRAAVPAKVLASDYAGHFQVREEALQASRAAAICVVHHDEGGRIVRIEPRG